MARLKFVYMDKITMAKNAIWSCLVMMLVLSISSDVLAQNSDEKKHQWRLGVGVDGFFEQKDNAGEGGVLFNFAIGDGKGRFQKLFTLNSSATGKLLSAGYEGNLNFRPLKGQFLSLFVGPGIMFNRWVDSVRIPINEPLENAISENLIPLVSVQHAHDGNKLVRWEDWTLVPYVGIGAFVPWEAEVDNTSGIYFVYRVGRVSWSYNPYSESKQSPFKSYLSFLVGASFKF